MAGLSMSWKDGKICLGVRPDLMKPSLFLEQLVNLPDLPATMKLSNGQEMSLDKFFDNIMTSVDNGNQLTSEGNEICFSQQQEDLLLSFAVFIEDIVERLNSSVNVRAALMDKIENVIVVIPIDVPLQTMRLFDYIVQYCNNINLSVVSCAEVLLSNHCEITKSITFISWNNVLKIECFETRKDSVVLQIGKTMQYQYGDTESLMDITQHHLRSAFRVQKAEHVCSDQWIVQASKELFATIIEGKSEFCFNYNNIQLKINQIDLNNIRKNMLYGVSRYIKFAVEKCVQTYESKICFLYGTNLRLFAEGLNHTSLKELKDQLKISINMDPIGTAVLLSVTTIKDNVRLPYDCGIVVRRHGLGNWVGTIVLVHGSKANTSATSKEFVWPSDRNKVLDVAMYVRRFDYKSMKIEQRISKEMVAFMPGVDSNRNIKFKVKMTLQSNEKGLIEEVATVICDEVSHNELKFPLLSFDGGEMYNKAIHHDISESDAKEWQQRIINSKGCSTVTDWRKALSVSGIKVSRISYFSWIFWGYLDYEKSHLNKCAPEVFQREACKFIRAKMVELAKSINGKYSKKWLETVEKTHHDAKIDVQVFSNSLLQDAPGKADTVSDLAHKYELACCEPNDINVDWVS